tara:strand:- start:12439 stop:14460 length:2022 start_codon:yes stop_codon:yes gene_type:complete
MNKAIKILTGLVAVILIIVVVIIATTDINQYKGQIINLVEDATGRNLQIGGDLKFALSLLPTVVVEDVTFSNASWGSQPEMMSLKKFELKVALLPLITGHIQVNKIILIDPKILLETNKEGTGNWTFFANKKSTKTAGYEGSTPSVVVNKVHIENATITYLNGVTGQQAHLLIDQITAESDAVNDPLSLVIEAAYNEIPISVTGHLGSLNQFTGNTRYPLDLAIEMSDATLSLNGQINKPMDGKGLDITAKFNIDSLAKLSTLVGNDLPDFGPINLTGAITDDKGHYSIESLVLIAGNTDLSGNVTANITEKHPTISATLNANLIDLAELTGDEKKVQATKTDRVFSSTPLPLDTLKSVNAKLSVNAKQIKTRSMMLTDSHVTVSLQDGLLIIKPLSSLMAGGQLTGSIDLNAKGKSAVLSTTISITGLEPNQLNDLKGKLSGAKTDVNLNFRGTGNSVSQIMANLNGKLLAKVGKGVITDSITGALGADVLTELVSLLNPFSQSSGNTQLQCAVVNFDIKGGMAVTDKGIAMSTNQMNIIGSGLINLKTEGLDIGIKPEAKEGLGINAGKLASFVRVGGTLAKPQATTDLTGALSTGLSVSTAFATGGLSLLAEGLFDRVTADADPCATAWGQKTATSQTTKQPNKSASSKAVDSIKGAGEAASDTIRGFFN